MSRNVVVTGLGATTPLGGDVPSTWARLLRAEPAFGPTPADWHQDLPCKIAAFMAVDPDTVLDRVEARKMDRCEQAAVVASREAWADAGSPEVDPLRLGAVMATGIGGILSMLGAYDLLLERGPSRISPHTVPMLMPNGPAAFVGLDLGALAGVHSPVSACASGAEAIAYGAEMIRNGRADIVVAGGTEAAIHPLTMSGFSAMRALSTRNDDPNAASRPYDTERDGFVMGEGAGALVLEAEEFARARGARIYAYVAGAGLTADGHHIAQPDPEGLGAARAMRYALAEADLSPLDIVHVNAHATSTPQGDVAEAMAIRSALGPNSQAIISATKSMTGHMLGGAGSVESVFTILALYNRLAPPTANLHNLDPQVDLDVTRSQPRALPSGDIAALKNSFGFGGHDVAVAFRSA